MNKTAETRAGAHRHPESFGRNRRVFACLMVLTIVCGLASRSKNLMLPGFFAEFGGDTLWATLIFLILGFLMPARRTWQIVALAFFLAVSVEISQLCHAPWIDAIRLTRIGGLVLGFGFLWSDILCYGIGIAGAAFIETCMKLRKSSPQKPPK